MFIFFFTTIKKNQPLFETKQITTSQSVPLRRNYLSTKPICAQYHRKEPTGSFAIYTIRGTYSSPKPCVDAAAGEEDLGGEREDEDDDDGGGDLKTVDHISAASRSDQVSRRDHAIDVRRLVR